MIKLNEKQIDRLFWIARWICLASIFASATHYYYALIATVPLYGIVCYFEGVKDGTKKNTRM